MAKKNWLDIATKVVTDTAVGALIPGGLIGKAAYVAGKEIVNNYLSDEDEEPSNVELAFDAYYDEKYEDALEYLEVAQANKEIKPFYYYMLSGKCHYSLMIEYRTEYWEEAEKLGLTEDTDDEDPRWKRIAHIKDSIKEERSSAYDLLKESLNHKKKDDYVVDKDEVASVYWVLTDVCETLYEQRRYDMAAMISDSIRKEAKEEYKSITKRIFDNIFNDGYYSIEKIKSGEDPENYPYDEELIEVNELQLFSSRDYHERQFIYIAKNIDALAGCYDDNIQWLFTIDALPKELQFPVGHPQPNSLYYAHPAKKGVYLPIEDADEELFNDKVRDFQRLAQCLGATEITFRSVKGHSLQENISKGFDVEVGGGYKGHEGSVGYGNKRSNSSSQSMKGEREMVQRFNPTKAPYVPDDVAWLAVDPEWQSLVKKRLDGNMLHYSVRISSRKTMSVSDSRMDDVKVAFKSFVASAHVNYSQQMERSFEREEETEWEISVSFKPLEELEKVERIEKPATTFPEPISIEEYHSNRIATEIQHYVLSVVYEDNSDKPDVQRVAQRINKDTGVSIPTSLISDGNKEEVKDVLTGYVAEEVGDKVDWHNLITTLPHKDCNDKFRMEVYDWDDVENMGGVMMGVITSGSISVGDRVRIVTNIKTHEYVDATVSWIEMFGIKLQEASAGDSLGLGIDIDINAISFVSTDSVVGFILKVDECEQEKSAELTDAEQEYLDNLKEFLEDDAEITSRERKMLDKIRQKLGITEERANELEASLSEPQLTEDEREYLDMYREYAEEGVITDKARRRLDKFANALGITDERVKEIEKM